MSFVLFGQMQDPNIASLRPYFDLFLDQEADYTWDLNTNILVQGGEPVTISCLLYTSPSPRDS